MITTFCPHCGRENPFDNQFCGKCGTALLQPKPVEPVAAARNNGSEPPLTDAEPEFEPERTIHGPSFLGLSDEPDLSSSYLLDDEPSSSHWGLYLFLVLLAAVGGLVWLQAGHGGLSRARLAQLVQQARARIGQQRQEAAAVAPNANPGAAENTNAPTPPPAAGSAASTGSAPNAGAAVAPPPSSTEVQNAAGKQNVPPPAALKETAAIAKPPSPSAKTRTRRAETAPAAPSLDEQNAVLLADAQRYLNGAGVPQSCDRALSYLREASDNRSVQAKSTLGGLYATGHCVPLDRAIAYRWFALALRQQPNNSYISHDLEMLWNQMTPQEKQLAIHMTQ